MDGAAVLVLCRRVPGRSPSDVLRVSEQKRSLVLGRAKDVDVILCGPQDYAHASALSRRHARLSLGENAAVYVEDLGSTNGVWVDNRRIPAGPPGTMLQAGDEVVFGRSQSKLPLPFVYTAQCSNAGSDATAAVMSPRPSLMPPSQATVLSSTPLMDFLADDSAARAEGASTRAAEAAEEKHSAAMAALREKFAAERQTLEERHAESLADARREVAAHRTACTKLREELAELRSASTSESAVVAAAHSDLVLCAEASVAALTAAVEQQKEARARLDAELACRAEKLKTEAERRTKAAESHIVVLRARLHDAIEAAKPPEQRRAEARQRVLKETVTELQQCIVGFMDSHEAPNGWECEDCAVTCCESCDQPVEECGCESPDDEWNGYRCRGRHRGYYRRERETYERPSEDCDCWEGTAKGSWDLSELNGANDVAEDALGAILDAGSGQSSALDSALCKLCASTQALGEWFEDEDMLAQEHIHHDELCANDPAFRKLVEKHAEIWVKASVALSDDLLQLRSEVVTPPAEKLAFDSPSFEFSREALQRLLASTNARLLAYFGEDPTHDYFGVAAALLRSSWKEKWLVRILLPDEAAAAAAADEQMDVEAAKEPKAVSVARCMWLIKSERTGEALRLAEHAELYAETLLSFAHLGALGKIIAQLRADVPARTIRCTAGEYMRAASVIGRAQSEKQEAFLAMYLLMSFATCGKGYNSEFASRFIEAFSFAHCGAPPDAIDAKTLDLVCKEQTPQHALAFVEEVLADVTDQPPGASVFGVGGWHLVASFTLWSRVPSILQGCADEFLTSKINLEGCRSQPPTHSCYEMLMIALAACRCLANAKPPISNINQHTVATKKHFDGIRRVCECFVLCPIYAGGGDKHRSAVRELGKLIRAVMRPLLNAAKIPAYCATSATAAVEAQIFALAKSRTSDDPLLAMEVALSALDSMPPKHQLKDPAIISVLSLAAAQAAQPEDWARIGRYCTAAAVSALAGGDVDGTRFEPSVSVLLAMAEVLGHDPAHPLVIAHRLLKFFATRLTAEQRIKALRICVCSASQAHPQFRQHLESIAGLATLKHSEVRMVIGELPEAEPVRLSLVMAAIKRTGGANGDYAFYARAAVRALTLDNAKREDVLSLTFASDTAAACLVAALAASPEPEHHRLADGMRFSGFQKKTQKFPKPTLRQILQLVRQAKPLVEGAVRANEAAKIAKLVSIITALVNKATAPTIPRPISSHAGYPHPANSPLHIATKAFTLSLAAVTTEVKECIEVQKSLLDIVKLLPCFREHAKALAECTNGLVARLLSLHIVETAAFVRNYTKKVGACRTNHGAWKNLCLHRCKRLHEPLLTRVGMLLLLVRCAGGSQAQQEAKAMGILKKLALINVSMQHGVTALVYASLRKQCLAVDALPNGLAIPAFRGFEQPQLDVRKEFDPLTRFGVGVSCAAVRAAEALASEPLPFNSIAAAGKWVAGRVAPDFAAAFEAKVESEQIDSATLLEMEAGDIAEVFFEDEAAATLSPDADTVALAKFAAVRSLVCYLFGAAAAAAAADGGAAAEETRRAHPLSAAFGCMDVVRWMRAVLNDDGIEASICAARVDGIVIASLADDEELRNLCACLMRGAKEEPHGGEHQLLFALCARFRALRNVLRLSPLASGTRTALALRALETENSGAECAADAPAAAASFKSLSSSMLLVKSAMLKRSGGGLSAWAAAAAASGPASDAALSATEAPSNSTVVVVLGNTGAGKSTTLNALVRESELLPTNCMRACTATIIEIGFLEAAEEGAGYVAEVDLVTKSEWTDELKLMRSAIEDAQTARDAEGDAAAEYDTPKPTLAFPAGTPAQDAVTKLRSVFGAGVDVGALVRCSPEELCTRTESVHTGVAQPAAEEDDKEDVGGGVARGALLGTRVRLSGGSGPALAIALGRFVDSAEASAAGGVVWVDTGNESGRAGAALWPLVKRVVVRGPFDALACGLRLVDAPGLHDANTHRGEMVKRVLARADTVLLASNIRRAVPVEE